MAKNPMQMFQGSKVGKRNFFVSLLIILGLSGLAPPVQGQALLPHTLQLDSAQLEQQGLRLAEEAAQLLLSQRFDLYEMALARAKLATQLAPKQKRTWDILAGAFFAVGSTQFQQQNYTQAIEHLQAGLKIKPDIPAALFDLGNAYYMLKQFQEAIAQYEKAIMLDATFWPAINNIGLIKYEQRDVEGALGDWRKAMAIDEAAAEPQLAIAVAIYTQGDREQGYALGEAALSLDPRYGDLEFLRENLWGERLLEDAKKFIETPRIQATLARTQESQIQSPDSSIP